MVFNLDISLRAEYDTIAAIEYYNSINVLLVDRFLTELYNTYDKIKLNPELYSLVSSNPKDRFRDVKLVSFPYVVIYEVIGTKVIITALMNTHKKPFIL